MNILVTGGAGFVGSHLLEELAKGNHNLWSLDNYSTGNSKNHVGGVKYFCAETHKIFELFYSKDIDLIYHLGEYSRVEQSFEDIDLVFEYNSKSIYEVIRFAKTKGAKIVYSGSSTRFGDHGKAVYTSPYAFTKKANAELIKTYCEWFDMQYAITYFYNVYGKREIDDGKYATVIAKFLKLKKDGHKSLPVTGDGKQERNFTDIRDIVNGLMLVGMHGQGDDFGIGSSENFSIIDLCNLLDCKPEFLPDKKGNRRTAELKTEKTEQLGWKQKYFLKDYIKEQLKLI